MLTRRAIVTRTLLAGAVWSSPLRPAGSAEHLTALPGKQPLIKRSFRPPNFETPLAALRAPFTANDVFFVRYHLPVIPEVDARAWRLEVGGASVRTPLRLSIDELRRGFERVEVAAINQCSGNRRGLFTPGVPGVQWGVGAMGNAKWAGVRLREVLDKAGVAPDALEVVLDGADSPVLPATPDFAKSLPIERARDENVLIAFEMNGRPLPHFNGAPARLVVPGWTATYWVKHLTSVRVEPKPFDGFWMKSAYRLPAGAFPGARFPSQETAENVPITEILVNSLVTSHTSGQVLARGRRAELSGWAWDGGSGIAAVEVSTDGGQTWREAPLGPDLGRFAWRGFRWPLDTSRAGGLDIGVRAKSRNGAQQPPQLIPNPSGYHHNAIQRLKLEVA
jgi:DMSO/TMAO reductase YedYZ molybdopterin-dependent catalytic subunit